MLKIDEIYDAIVVKSVCNGLLVSIPQYEITEVVKTREIYAVNTPKERQKIFNFGDTVRVKVLQKIELPQYMQAPVKERYQLSIRLANFDPWDDIEHSLHWHPGSKKKFSMRIALTTKETASGEIIPGVTAVVKTKDIYDFLHDKNPQTKMDLQIKNGDIVAGYIHEIRPEFRKVYLDVVSYLKDIHTEINIINMDEDLKNENPSLIYYENRQSIKQILIIDDAPLLCNALHDNLAQEGYFVRTATAPNATEQAMKLLEKEPFDLIILDLHLPSFSEGLTLLNEIYANNKYIKIIISSSSDNSPNQQQLEAIGDAGIVNFLRKPYSLDELMDTITEAEGAMIRPIRDFFHMENFHEVNIAEIANNVIIGPTLLRLIESFKSEVSADAIAVFEVNRNPIEVKTLLQVGIDPSRLEKGFHFLHLSPVKDCAISNQIFHTDSAHLPKEIGKHKNLMRIVDYTSCIGVPIQGPNGTAQCLFAFKLQGKFTAVEMVKAETIAARIERQELDDWYRNALVRKATEATAGITFGMLGHELKTKLVASNLFASALRRFLHASQPDQKNKILENIDKLHGTIDRMLKIASMFRRLTEQGKETQSDIFKVIDSAKKEISDYAKQESISMNITISKPDISLSAVPGSDSTLLQIFFNVLLNAVQQSLLFWENCPAYIHIKISTGLYNEKNHVFIDIGDRGPGIHSGDFERIFKPMVTTRPEGAGLGLHLCRSELQNLKGDIFVKSSILFAGTVFRIRLPIMQK
jgi:signal transduction histidine kinase/ActR/RegA family two-component response regulator